MSSRRRRVLAAACACACAAVSFVGLRAAPLRPEFTGSHAVVAAGRSFTVDAGARLIDQGGNAIDAGVASIFAAAVVEISHFGLGGESPIVIASARDKTVVVINGQGPAPKDATPALFPGKASPPGNGPLGATVPAVVDAAALALAHYGTKSLAEVMAPAIALADGFPMYEFLRHYLETERANCEPYAATMATYYPGGRITPTGEVFRQPNLATTMRAIVAAEKAALDAGTSRAEAIRAGRDAFYRGDIGRRIAAANREAGGVMSETDLSSYQGRVETPQTTRYRGYDVYKAGFWNQSPVLLQTLNLLEGFDLKAMGAQSAGAVHVITESIKLAYADRDRYYGDPDFVDVPGRGLLSKQYAEARRALIDLARASKEHRPGDPRAFERATSSSAGLPALFATPLAMRTVDAATPPPEPGDTTAIQVVDAQGNLFSATPSSGWLLGGAFVAGDTGVPMGNRMQAFRLDPQSPNVLQGGKRPRTTLTPTVVMKDGAPFLAIGTPGGDSQDQQILLVLLNVIDFGMGLQAAIEAPRVNSLHPESSFDEHRAQPGVLEVESTLGPDVLAELRARGHELRVRPAYGMSTGIVAAGRDPRDPPASWWRRSPTRTLRRRMVNREMQIAYEKRTLANGLDVIVHEDRDLPIVAVNVWYHVGSKNERPGLTGFAHLFEHLMFEGSAHHDHGYFPPLQEAGASLNGSTNADRTNYWEVVPIGALDRALWMESDRMGWLLPALTQAKLDNQRDVVLNERRQNYENRPYGLAQIAIAHALYPSAHSYYWPTIGDVADIRAATLDDVSAFFARYYHPANASLTLAGDVDATRAFDLAEQYFGAIPAGPLVGAVVPPPVTLGCEVRLVLEDRVEFPRLYLAWHSPALFADGDAECDLLADLLSNGKTSRLFRKLVHERRVALDVAAYQSSRELAGMFQVIATAAAGMSLETVRAEIDDVMRDVATTGPTTAEMTRGRAQAESGFVQRLQTIGGFSGKSDQLNAYNVFLDDPGAFGRDLARYRTATADRVRAAAAAHAGAPRVALGIVPRGRRDLGLAGSGEAVAS